MSRIVLKILFKSNYECSIIFIVSENRTKYNISYSSDKIGLTE